MVHTAHFENTTRRNRESPKVANKEWSKEDTILRKYINEYKKTGICLSEYPEEIWKRLPIYMRNEIENKKKNRLVSQSCEYPIKTFTREPTKYEKKSDHRAVISQEELTETLSDDAFTAYYDTDYWRSLPERVRAEISRQRRIKDARAKLQKASSANA